jgi:myo-inositol-1(or 4)-monophosphatase
MTAPPTLDGLDLSPYRAGAEAAAREAGRIIQDYRGRFQVVEKGRSDLLTSADPAAQAAVIGMIRSVWPDHTFLGEEDGARPDPDKPFRWIIDPLDGTTNYVHGFPFYAVSVGLEIAGRLSVGVVYDPVHDEMFSAARGAGATCNGRPIRVSEVSRLSAALLATGFPPLLGDDATARRLADTFIRFARATHSVVRFGSAALSLAYVACGRLDAVYAYNWKPWDTAAGAVIVSEAGGRVSNTAGGAFDLYSPDLLVSNGRVHAEAAATAAG